MNPYSIRVKKMLYTARGHSIGLDTQNDSASKNFPQKVKEKEAYIQIVDENRRKARD
jgi:hypothetical protein